MLRTGILVLTCALVLGGCAQTPENAARNRAILGGIAEMEKTPVSQPSTEMECVSEKQYDGKVVTHCKDDPHARALRQVSGQ